MEIDINTNLVVSTFAKLAEFIHTNKDEGAWVAQEWSKFIKTYTEALTKDMPPDEALEFKSIISAIETNGILGLSSARNSIDYNLQIDSFKKSYDRVHETQAKAKAADALDAEKEKSGKKVKKFSGPDSERIPAHIALSRHKEAVKEAKAKGKPKPDLQDTVKELNDIKNAKASNKIKSSDESVITAKTPAAKKSAPTQDVVTPQETVGPQIPEEILNQRNSEPPTEVTPPPEPEPTPSEKPVDDTKARRSIKQRFTGAIGAAFGVAKLGVKGAMATDPFLARQLLAYEGAKGVVQAVKKGWSGTDEKAKDKSSLGSAKATLTNMFGSGSKDQTQTSNEESSKEAADAQGKVVEVLNKIEENTRNKKSDNKKEDDKKGWVEKFKSFLSTLMGGWFGKIISTLGSVASSIVTGVKGLGSALGAALKGLMTGKALGGAKSLPDMPEGKGKGKGRASKPSTVTRNKAGDLVGKDGRPLTGAAKTAAEKKLASQASSKVATTGAARLGLGALGTVAAGAAAAYTAFDAVSTAVDSYKDIQAGGTGENMYSNAANAAVEFVTGEEGATLGSKAYDIVDSISGTKFANMLGFKSDEQKQTAAEKKSIEEMIAKNIASGKELSPALVAMASKAGVSIPKEAKISAAPAKTAPAPGTAAIQTVAKTAPAAVAVASSKEVSSESKTEKLTEAVTELAATSSANTKSTQNIINNNSNKTVMSFKDQARNSDSTFIRFLSGNYVMA